jgi:hypothetical protein
MTASSSVQAAFAFPWVVLLPPIDLLPPPVPVVEIVKVYGSLATSECYGSKAPLGSSCQLPLAALEKELGMDKSSSISQDNFDTSLQRLDFQWPLKPYGIDGSERLKKTAVMNKGAETRVYMEELEARRFYDRRNPTGPLPTSLRPQLNKALKAEGIHARVSKLVFSALGGNSMGILTKDALESKFGDAADIDFYGFLDLIGKDQISWPN